MKVNLFVKKLLKKKGVTQVAIARICNVTPVSVNDVISGKRKNPRIRAAIALALGMSVSEIHWPEPAKEKRKKESRPSEALRAL